MNNFKRISRLVRACSISLLWVFALLCVPGQARAATPPLTGTFVGEGTGQQVTFSHKGKAHNDWAGVLRFKLDNGPEVPVFCIQIEVRVSSGDRYRSDGPVLKLPNGCKIRYLLQKYPASSAKDAPEAAARQLAIWAFSDNVDPTTITDQKIRDRAIALVNEAKKGACPKTSTEVPELVIDPPAASGSAGQTIAYIVRAGPASAGQPVTLKLTGPATFADAAGASTGQQQQTLPLDAQGLAQFWVAGTGEGQTSIQADLPYQIDAGTVFSQLDDSSPSQRLVLGAGQKLVARAVGQLHWVAGAPQPSPTNAPPAPTDRPEHENTPVPELPTQLPTLQPAEQPTPQPTDVVSGGAVTATPEAPAPTEAVPAPANQSGNGPAGGAAPVAPRSLPRTGETAVFPGSLLLIGIFGLLIAGWMLRRQATRQ